METKSKQGSVRVSKNVERDVSSTVKLFVYGIFLDEMNRLYYGMENPSYDTVRGYITVGDSIVTAVPSTIIGSSLTGLLVDVPVSSFPRLDLLESGYDRIKVTTTSGFEAFMYAAHGSGFNYSNIRSGFYESETEEQPNLAL